MATASSSRLRDSIIDIHTHDEDLPEDYKPYVPVAKRRAQLLSTLTSKTSAKKAKVSDSSSTPVREVPRSIEEDEERAREKARRERTLLQAAQEVKEKKALQGQLAAC
jgi:ATP-dependent RNA helicase DDX41